jgi:hypothetical protein
MRFNVNKPPKHIQRELDEKARREWHKKFAWKYTKVDKTDEGHRVVWFENYWRKEKIGPTNAQSKDDGRYFEQYSEKEYFKKKLNGDFDKPEYDMEDAASDMVQKIKDQMNQRSGQQIQNAGIHKKGGPHNSNVRFKKYTVGGPDQDIEVETIFMGDEEDGYEEDY